MCKACEHIRYEKKNEFSDPECVEIRRWYHEEIIHDDLLNKNTRYSLFERRFIPNSLNDWPVWYMNVSGQSLIPIKYCPQCGRELL